MCNLNLERTYLIWERDKFVVRQRDDLCVGYVDLNYDVCYSFFQKMGLRLITSSVCCIKILSQDHSPWPQSCYAALQGGAVVLPFVSGTGLGFLSTAIFLLVMS